MRRGRKVSVLVVLQTFLLWSVAASMVLTGSVQAIVEPTDDRATVTRTGQTLVELAPGHPIDQTLGPNETYSYETKLSTGHYLGLAVAPQGIDVLVTILAPDGHQVLKKSSPYGAQGPVNSCFVTGKGGTYKIDVTATDNNAHAGRYQIGVSELRKATLRDVNRFKAEEILSQAQQQQVAGTFESKRNAIVKYYQAVSLLKQTGDRLAEAQTIEQLSSLQNDLGNNKKAIDLVRQSLQMFQSLRDRRGEGLALSDLGSIENDLGDNKKALAHLIEALEIRREIGDRRGEAETLEYIGDVYDNTSETNKAIENFNAALSLRKGIGDRRGEAQSLDDVGLVYYDTDEEQTALGYFAQALTIQQSLRDFWGEALTLNNFGVSYDSLGEKRKSLDYFMRTLPLKRAVGNRRGEAKTLSNMCTTETTLGEWQTGSP